jgi:hypothetical protein
MHLTNYREADPCTCLSLHRNASSRPRRYGDLATGHSLTAALPRMLIEELRLDKDTADTGTGRIFDLHPARALALCH